MHRLRRLDRRLVTILLIVFVQIFGASMALPILPLYAQSEFALSDRVIPLLISVFFAAQFVAGPTIGRLSDQYGRVPVLLVSQIGTVIAFIGLATATAPWMLFVARVFDGITGGNIIAAQAYVTDITPPEKRTESLGYVFAALGFGFIFGPAIGGVLSGFLGPRAPFWLAAAGAAVVVALTAATLNETVSAERRAANRAAAKQQTLGWRQIQNNTALVYILAIAFVAQFAFGLLQATFSLWGEAVIFSEFSERDTYLGIGLLLSIVGVTQFLTQAVFLRRLLRRHDELTLIIWGSVSRIIGTIIFALITTPWLGPLGSIFFAFGLAITLPSLQSLATETVPDEVRGAVLGVVTSSTNLGTIFSTALSGFLFAVIPTLQYWVGIVLTLVALIPAFALRRWQARA